MVPALHESFAVLIQLAGELLDGGGLGFLRDHTAGTDDRHDDGDNE